MKRRLADKCFSIGTALTRLGFWFDRVGMRIDPMPLEYIYDGCHDDV